jgi:dienelactone hydrolase
MRIEHGGETLVGIEAKPTGDGSFPAVLVMHSAVGLNAFYRSKPALLAEHGYLAVATNMYGEDVDVTSEASYGAAYMKTLENPAMVRERTLAWFEAIAARPDVDASRIAAIGYCFGGHCVLELARSGADAKAVVSYHGTLKTDAPMQPGAFKGHVAAYCGAEDPYAPMEDITALRKEMAAAGARYAMHVFADVAHGFTDPEAANHSQPGIAYDAVADRVSWAGTLALLGEVLK